MMNSEARKRHATPPTPPTSQGEVMSETTQDWRDVPHVRAGTDCGGGDDCPARPEPCVAPPGNLCTDTGCWDADKCLVYQSRTTLQAKEQHPDGLDSLPIAMLLHSRLASWFGDDRQSFLVSDLVPVVTQIVAEFQHNAVEMARKAAMAEDERDAALADCAVLSAERDDLDSAVGSLTAEVVEWRERAGGGA